MTVILQDEKLPRNKSKLGKVVEVHISIDGIVRKLKLYLSYTTCEKGKLHNRTTPLEMPIQKGVTLKEAN